MPERYWLTRSIVGPVPVDRGDGHQHAGASRASVADGRPRGDDGERADCGIHTSFALGRDLDEPCLAFDEEHRLFVLDGPRIGLAGAPVDLQVGAELTETPRPRSSAR